MCNETSQNGGNGGKTEISGFRMDFSDPEYIKIINKERGKKAELLFADFLNKNFIPFVHIDQSKEGVSTGFRSKFIRRADFIVHSQYNIYDIDVKCREKQFFGKDKRFYLNQEELESLNNLQNELRSNVWIAFIDDKDKQEKYNFYYASIVDINEYYKFISNGFKKKPKEINDYFDTCPIGIPKLLLFDSLSLEKGIYKSHEANFSENDIQLHVNKMIEWLEKESYKGYNGLFK